MNLNEESLRSQCQCVVTSRGDILFCPIHRVAPKLLVAGAHAIQMLKFMAHFIADRRPTRELYIDVRPGESVLEKTIGAIDEMRKAVTDIHPLPYL